MGVVGIKLRLVVNPGIILVREAKDQKSSGSSFSHSDFEVGLSFMRPSKTKQGWYGGILPLGGQAQAIQGGTKKIKQNPQKQNYKTNNSKTTQEQITKRGNKRRL